MFDKRKCETIEALMKEAKISSVSMSIVTKDASEDKLLGVKHHSVFGVASLSKAVFAYLVLTLIDKGFLKLNERLNEIIRFEDFCNKNNYYRAKSNIKEDAVWVSLLTPEMILSHRSGLPIGYNDEEGPLLFQGKPGVAYGYSGIPFIYLQQVIEKITHKSLEDLAKEHVFEPLGMKNSSFYFPDTNKPANAANSLHTTTHDYALFMKAWIKDKALNYAFKKRVSLTTDQWANDLKIQHLNRLACGLGMHLQLDEAATTVTTAFHSGDMEDWRAWVAVDLINEKIIVYFANSCHGHLLAETILFPHVKIDVAADYFFKKYGFARTVEELDVHSPGLRKSFSLPVKGGDSITDKEITDEEMAKSVFANKRR